MILQVLAGWALAVAIATAVTVVVGLSVPDRPRKRARKAGE